MPIFEKDWLSVLSYVFFTIQSTSAFPMKKKIYIRFDTIFIPKMHSFQPILGKPVQYFVFDSVLRVTLMCTQTELSSQPILWVEYYNEPFPLVINSKVNFTEFFHILSTLLYYWSFSSVSCRFSVRHLYKLVWLALF